MLTHLRELDYDNFKWLLEELKIEYTPPDEYAKFKDSKRSRRIKAAREQAFAIRREKLEEYRKKLKKEKVNFLEIKGKEMANIEDQMEQLGLSCGDSLLDRLRQLDPVKYPSKNPPTHSRRWYRLKHKFDMHEEKMKLERAKQTPVNQIQ